MRRVGILPVLLLSLVIGCNSWDLGSGRAGTALVLDGELPGREVAPFFQQTLGVVDQQIDIGDKPVVRQG